MRLSSTHRGKWTDAGYSDLTFLNRLSGSLAASRGRWPRPKYREQDARKNATHLPLTPSPTSSSHDGDIEDVKHINILARARRPGPRVYPAGRKRFQLGVTVA